MLLFEPIDNVENLNIESTFRELHSLWYLVSPTIRSYKAILFSKNVKTYQVKSFMWYNNTRTTYFTFVDQKNKIYDKKL